MRSLFIPTQFNHGNFKNVGDGIKSQDICQELTVTTGHTQGSSSEILRILQNTMIVRWYMLHVSTEAKWSSRDCFILKILEMNRSKQTEIS